MTRGDSISTASLTKAIRDAARQGHVWYTKEGEKDERGEQRVRKYWLSFLAPKITQPGAVLKSVEQEAFKSLVAKGACKIHEAPPCIPRSELNETLQKVHRPRNTPADGLFTYKYVLASGADLERDGADGQATSEVRALWDLAVSYRAMACAWEMAWAWHMPGVWPMANVSRATDCFVATTLQLKQLQRVIDITPLAQGHGFASNFVHLQPQAQRFLRHLDVECATVFKGTPQRRRL